MNPISSLVPAEFIGKALWLLIISLLLLVIYYLINIGNRYVDNEKRIDISNGTIISIVLSLVGFYILSRIFRKNEFLYSLVSTVFISIIIAYALNPLINKMEEKGISRMKGVLMVYAIILVVIILFGVIVIPKSVREIKNLVTNLPLYIEELNKMVNNFISNLTKIMGDLSTNLDGYESSIVDSVKGLESVIVENVKSFATGIFGFASKAVNIVLTPILTLYFIVDKDYFKEKLTNAIPDKFREEVLGLARTIDGSLISYIKARLIMSIYVWVVMTISLLILRIDFAFIIGFITGLFDIVPYIGPFIGYLPAVFFAVLDSPMKAVWLTVLFTLIQWTENNVLGPKVLGENMGLHPMVVLLATIVGGGVFGVFGMILSVPAAATIKIIFEYFNNMRKERKREIISEK